MNPFRLSGRYIFISFIAVVLSFFFHELAHWITGELLGYKMGMSFNKTFYIGGDPVSKSHEMWVSAAGPFFTLLQAFVFFLWLRKYRNENLYPFLFFAFYMRLLAGVLNFIHLNDEGRISAWLGIGNFTISIFVCSLLLWLVYKISKENRYPFKFQWITFLLVMFFSSVVILSDQYLHLRIIR